MAGRSTRPPPRRRPVLVRARHRRHHPRLPCPTGGRQPLVHPCHRRRPGVHGRGLRRPSCSRRPRWRPTGRSSCGRSSIRATDSAGARLAGHGFRCYRGGRPGRRSPAVRGGSAAGWASPIRSARGGLGGGARARRGRGVERAPDLPVRPVARRARPASVWARGRSARLRQAARHRSLFHLWFHPYNITATPSGRSLPSTTSARRRPACATRAISTSSRWVISRPASTGADPPAAQIATTEVFHSGRCSPSRPVGYSAMAPCTESFTLMSTTSVRSSTSQNAVPSNVQSVNCAELRVLVGLGEADLGHGAASEVAAGHAGDLVGLYVPADLEREVGEPAWSTYTFS